ncbi:hypothetical protein JTB14_025161 [Gonioctena quinquepunctata]|nr:hypothetical protein JTB14_025161 [Gonioctena quinquepunctata]
MMSSSQQGAPDVGCKKQEDKLIENQNFTLKALCDQIDLLKRSTNNKHFNQLSAQQVTSQGEKRNLVDIPETIGECPASSTKPAHSAILKNPIVSYKGKAIAVSSVPVVTSCQTARLGPETRGFLKKMCQLLSTRLILSLSVGRSSKWVARRTLLVNQRGSLSCRRERRTSSGTILQ